MLSLILGLIGAALGAVLLVVGLLTVDPEEGWSLPTFLISLGAIYLLGGMVLVLASLVFRRLRDRSSADPETTSPER